MLKIKKTEKIKKFKKIQKSIKNQKIQKIKMLNISILDTCEYSWLKNSEFYKSLDLDNKNDQETNLNSKNEQEIVLDINFCSINEQDPIKYLNVINLWGITIFSNEFISLIFKSKPIEKIKELIELTHSKKYQFLLELCTDKHLYHEYWTCIKYGELEFLKYLPKDINLKIDVLMEEMDIFKSKNDFIIQTLIRRVEDYGL